MNRGIYHHTIGTNGLITKILPELVKSPSNAKNTQVAPPNQHKDPRATNTPSVEIETANKLRQAAEWVRTAYQEKSSEWLQAVLTVLQDAEKTQPEENKSEFMSELQGAKNAVTKAMQMLDNNQSNNPAFKSEIIKAADGLGRAHIFVAAFNKPKQQSSGSYFAPPSSFAHPRTGRESGRESELDKDPFYNWDA